MNVTKRVITLTFLMTRQKATGLFWRTAKYFLGEVVRLGMPWLFLPWSYKTRFFI